MGEPTNDRYRAIVKEPAEGDPGPSDIIRMKDGRLNKPVHVLSNGAVVVGCTYITRDAMRELRRQLGRV